MLVSPQMEMHLLAALRARAPEFELLCATIAPGHPQDDADRYWLTLMGPSVLTAAQEQATEAGAQFTECANGCPTMIVAPAGSYMMGSPATETDRSANEGPQHRVTIAKPFAVGKTEVTFGQWDACVAAGACREVSDNGWGRGDRPVINVGWSDAARYAQWLAGVTGKPYRLLSEAEWEYAARAGTTTRFSFGDDDIELGRYAWYTSRMPSARPSQPAPSPPTASACTTCMATSTNGWQTLGTTITRRHLPTARPGRTTWRHIVMSFAAAHGSSTRRISRSASRAGPPSDLQDGNVGFRVARSLLGVP